MKKIRVENLIGMSIAIALLGSLSLGTSPFPPPYHQYNVMGFLERSSGESKENFSVILLAKLPNSPDTGFQHLRGINWRYGDLPVGFTDSSGAFYVRVSSNIKADSLRLAVIVPDKPLTLGIPFYVDGSLAIPNTEVYTAEKEPGCAGCSVQPETKERIVFYSYNFDNKIITISF